MSAVVCVGRCRTSFLFARAYTVSPRRIADAFNGSLSSGFLNAFLSTHGPFKTSITALSTKVILENRKMSSSSDSFKKPRGDLKTDVEGEGKGESNEVFADNWFDDDDILPDYYREVSQSVKSLRIDGVLALGLAVSRQVLEEDFYGKRVLINGQRLMKKAQQVNPGDCLDLISSGTEDKKAGSFLRRVRVVAIEKEDEGKFRIYLRAWRRPFPMSSERSQKS